MRSGSAGVGLMDAVLVYGDADGSGHEVSLWVGLAVGLRARRGSGETDGTVPMGGTEVGPVPMGGTEPPLQGGKKEEEKDRASGNETAL